MKSLESENSPLRSQQNFYKPFYKVRQQTHKKTFDSCPKQNPVLNTL